MGIMEMEFAPIVKKVMEQPERIEPFIRSLVLLLERQRAIIMRVQWSKDAEEAANEAGQLVSKFLIDTKAEVAK